MVAPKDALVELKSRFDDSRLIFCSDEREGLSSAINRGMHSLPKDIEFVNWLGDDDILVPESLKHLRHMLIQHGSASLAYGKCIYFDHSGASIFQTHARRSYVSLMRFGPQLVSQPASLFKREHFNAVGMLNPGLRYAFDLDLFIRLSKIGTLHAVPHVCAYFGWHSESLSVGSRSTAAREASSVRLGYYHRSYRWLMRPYEMILRRVITLMGRIVTYRARCSRRVTKI